VPRAERVDERRNGAARHAERKSAPACVRDGGRTGPGIDNRNRRAVGCLNRERRVDAGCGDNVRVGEWFGRIARAIQTDVGSVDLASPDESAGCNPGRGRDVRPRVRAVAVDAGPEPPRARRIKMVGVGGQRPAPKRRPGRPSHPLEVGRRFRQRVIEVHDEICSHEIGINMNIIGLGFDATDIDRVADVIERFGQRFLERVFTDAEMAYCTRRRVPAIHFAGRFAAKEAGMKALGTGHSRGVRWRDVEVLRQGGPPQLRFHGAAARHFDAMGGVSALLTITHSDDLAMAQVLLLGR